MAPFLVNALNLKSFVQKQLYRRHIIRPTRIVKGVPTEAVNSMKISILNKSKVINFNVNSHSLRKRLDYGKTALILEFLKLHRRLVKVCLTHNISFGIIGGL